MTKKIPSPPHSFYVPPSDWPLSSLCDEENLPLVMHLPQEEAHHACRVLRLQTDEIIRLLDGEGREGLARIEDISKAEKKRGKAQKSTLPLSLLQVKKHERPRSGLILAPAWTKAARKTFLFEKIVEFDAAGLWFWQGEHSQFPLADAPKEAWQAQCIAGMKQCNNPFLPNLQVFPQGIRELIEASTDIPHKYVLAESRHGEVATMNTEHLAQEGQTLCVLGPEGGFAPYELEALFAAGFKPLSLGERVLRWESAAVLCLGLHYWQKIVAKEQKEQKTQ